MGFSDQEEQFTNSAETGETEPAEDSAVLQADAETPDSEVESSPQELELPGLEDSDEIDATEIEPGEQEPEIDSQADVEIDSSDSVEEEPMEFEQPLDEQQDSEPLQEEPLLAADQTEPELVSNRSGCKCT